ncbi:hypothetical protein EV191_1011507 [Tamaricihabitans halophyticus]|uniref:Uncharacterized protein n=1 Tax=Tamaricihabitans halophyticus TaxID=1262583 RepID=A0A4R2R3W9_9PSEU|nr:hypothetical protein EV191_1011507 [Tamaricihabitans halophyticus]
MIITEPDYYICCLWLIQLDGPAELSVEPRRRLATSAT